MNLHSHQSVFTDEQSHDDVTVLREVLHAVKGLLPISGMPEIEFAGEETELASIEAYDFEQ